MDEELTEYPTQRIRVQQCPVCGRQFNTESLKKHQTICRKVSNKKRRVFDAGKQRATDSDVPYKATKRTMQVYTGEVRPQEDKFKGKSKTNWREKHNQLIQSIREARTVTRAIKEGGPLPRFRPSEVPSDYVSCPHCHRNFNESAAQRHIPFCQTQHERKHTQPSRSNKQVDRGRAQPSQHSSGYRQQQQQPQQQQQSNLDPYSNSRDNYHNGYNNNGYNNNGHNNGYKQSNSAPMATRRNPSELPAPPPPRKATGNDGGGWGGFKKLFGFGSKQESSPPRNYYTPEEEDDYEPPARYPAQHQPVLMRTGRTQENTSLNVRARQRSDEGTTYMRRGPPPPPPPGPPSYSQARSHYGNGQYSSTRPTAVGRLPPQSSGARCGECGGIFNNATARYCPQCGSRR